jgi:hypothetical protein
MSRGKTAGSQADDCHRKQSKKLLGYKNSAQFISPYVYKENLLYVTAWFYIQRRKDKSDTAYAPKRMQLEKVIPKKFGI